MQMSRGDDDMPHSTRQELLCFVILEISLARLEGRTYMLAIPVLATCFCRNIRTKCSSHQHKSPIIIEHL